MNNVVRNGAWLNLVERYVRDVEVACSNHVTPTFESLENRAFFISMDFPEISFMYTSRNL